MIDKMREEVQKLCLDIIQNINSTPTAELTEKVEMLYEKLLTSKLLEQKQIRLNRLSDRIAQNVKDDNTSMPPIKDEENPNYGSGGEIKVVPIPEGPPKSNRYREDEMPSVKNTDSKVEKIVEVRETKPEKTAQRSSPSQTTTHLEMEHTRISATIKSKIHRPLNIGLNDRIAFVKHLFKGSQEDLNRVTSQINTFDSYDEAEDFLLNTVQPDYNWEGKEEYVERFITLLKARYGVD